MTSGWLVTIYIYIDIHIGWWNTVVLVIGGGSKQFGTFFSQIFGFQIFPSWLMKVQLARNHQPSTVCISGVSPIEWCPGSIPYRLVSYRVYRIPSIGLVYLPTWMVDFYGRLVGKYTNPISLSNVLCRGGIGYHPTSRLKSCEKRRGAETMTRETGGKIWWATQRLAKSWEGW